MDTILLLLLSTLITLSLSKDYAFVSTSMTQCDAQYHCETNFNGNLASIDSEDENDQVATLCDSTRCLIGLQNRDSSSLGFWINGEQVTYTNWAPDQPDNQVNEPYVVIGTLSKQWSTVSRIRFPFICEVNSVEYIVIHQWQCMIYGDRLLPDEHLTTDECLTDTNRRYVAALQSDGNFVIYDLLQDDANLGPGKAVWSTGTFSSDPNRFLVLQTDGNLVLYSGGSPNEVRWAADDYNDHPLYLIMQTDGNLVAYGSNGAYWDRWGHSGKGWLDLDFLYDQNNGLFLTQSDNGNNWIIMAGIVGILLVIFGAFYYKRYRGKDEFEPLMDDV